ncbi:FAD-dependent monooxygenase [Novosphingobium sp. JCM 18896]|nr:FAD-dependent monooxygenase [Novosphingobium sp. JCM 18896]
MKRRSIAIAGCGIGGLATGLLLARAGERVALFERFEKPRPIGSGLMIQPTGLAVLAKLHLAERIRHEGARIDRLFGRAGDRVVLDVSYSAMPRGDRFGIGIHRASLFAALHDAILAEGIDIRTDHTVVGSRLVAGGRSLLFADGQASEGFDLVVDGLGTRSALAPPTGYELDYGALWASLDWPGGSPLDPHTLSQRYRRSSTMAGVLPLGVGAGETLRAAFFWSLKGTDYPRSRETGLAAWKQEVLALWPECEPFLEQIVDRDQLTFARYAHRTLKTPLEDRLVHIGDAWHSASPQLGQGANMALLDAWALARALSEHGDIAQALTEAIALRRRHVKLYQALTCLFTPVYQSDSRLLPFVRDRLVGPVSKLWPATAIQASMVSGLIGDPLGTLGLEEYSALVETQALPA